MTYFRDELSPPLTVAAHVVGRRTLRQRPPFSPGWFAPLIAAGFFVVAVFGEALAQSSDSRKAISGEDAPPAIAEIPAETYLGVFTVPVPVTLAAQLADLLPEGAGLVVTSIVPDSPAATVGMQPHDILLAVDGRKMRQVDELKREITARQPGDRIELDLIRRARRTSVTVELAHRPVLPEPGRQHYQVVRTPSQTRISQSPANPGAEPNASGAPATRKDVILVERNGKKEAVAEAAAAVPAKMSPNGSLTVVRSKDGAFDVRWSPWQEKGAADETGDRKATVTPDSMKAKLKNWPAPARDAATELVDQLVGIGSETRPQRGVQVRIQPRVAGNARGVRIVLQSSSGGSELRIFQLDHLFPPETPVRMSDLLALDSLKRELAAQDPAIRKSVEQTLGRLTLPEVRIQVQKSQ